MKKVIILAACLALVLSLGAQDKNSKLPTKNNPYYSRTDTTHLQVSNDKWKKILPAELYAVAREQATEEAFTGKYWNADTRGTYYCAVCGVWTKGRR